MSTHGVACRLVDGFFFNTASWAVPRLLAGARSVAAPEFAAAAPTGSCPSLAGPGLGDSDRGGGLPPAMDGVHGRTGDLLLAWGAATSPPFFCGGVFSLLRR